MADSLELELEKRVEALGYEFVELETTGTKARPILRVRIDRPDSTPGNGVSIEDCTKVSRALEEYLDADEALSERYTLEVSSPGIERPLTRPRDFARFKGQEIAVKGTRVLSGNAKRVEGELLGLEERDGQEVVRLRMKNGSEVEFPRSDVERAHLVFKWDER